MLLALSAWAIVGEESRKGRITEARAGVAAAFIDRLSPWRLAEPYPRDRPNAVQGKGQASAQDKCFWDVMGYGKQVDSFNQAGERVGLTSSAARK
jgi:hypothetical protein